MLSMWRKRLQERLTAPEGFDRVTRGKSEIEQIPVAAPPQEHTQHAQKTSPVLALSSDKVSA